MLKPLIEKTKRLVNFPGLSAPPETIPSTKSIASIHLNIALIIIIYGFFGDIFISIAAALLLFFNFSRYRKKSEPLNKMFLLSLQAVCIGLFFWRFNGSTGGQSWMGLLALLVCLKSLESKSLRDYYVTTLMMFFLAAIIFAYNNSAIAPIALGVFSISVLGSMMLLSQSRIAVNDTTNSLYKDQSSSIQYTQVNHQESSLFSIWKPASKILLQALPITILLFFLFPRIQGSFGFLPNDNQNLNPSLSNQLSAGSYSERATSKELAFRVEFLPDENGNIINIGPQDLYWRVKTFSTQDGFSWKINNTIDAREQSFHSLKTRDKNRKEYPSVDYAITHQPTADNFIPSLETVTRSNLGLILSNSSIREKSKTNTFRYTANSILKPQVITKTSGNNPFILTPSERKQYTQTTLSPGKKTRQLLNTWLAESELQQLGEQQTRPDSKQAKEIALKALNYFRNQPFSYHLLPPEVDSNNPIEDFLFNTQSGYCEHYASTFSTLMRWLDIPSRVIVGFQGGDFNQSGNFYEVRYSSAHAWSEIWTDNDGWIRADPTAFVAPERIEFGMDALLALMQENEQEGFKSGDFSLKKLRDALNPSGSFAFLEQAQNLLDVANHSWDKWVVNYDFEQQSKLLKTLGLNSNNQYVTLIIILGICLSIFAAIILWLIWPKRIKKSPTEEAYALFKKKLKKLNIAINTSEGPSDLNKKLISLLPHHATDIEQINQYYIESQYKNDNKNLSLFIQSVKHFRPKLA